MGTTVFGMMGWAILILLGLASLVALAVILIRRASGPRDQD